MEMCSVENCDKPVLKTNSEGNYVCEKHFWNSMPILGSLPGRNEKCLCDSGKKFKSCCWSVMMENRVK